jgi:peptidyl-prolyl cis-trans isomerase SurA
LKELKEPPQIKDVEFKTQIDDLRKHLPACGGDKCETEAGWNAVLASQGFTQDQFQSRWRVRMLVLNFIEQRFRAGVRVAKPEIQAYYDNSFVPQFKKRNLPAPPLAKVSTRIDEILLQQHVNGLLAEWLNSLKDQGNVAILDPQFQQAAGQTPSDDAGDDE